MVGEYLDDLFLLVLLVGCIAEGLHMMILVLVCSISTTDLMSFLNLEMEKGRCLLMMSDDVG